MKKSLLLSLLAVIVLLLNSCNKDDNEPVAAFSADKMTAKVGETITFTNLSLNAGLCIWYFGDGNIDAINKNITTHSYSSAGSFTVELLVNARADSGSKKFADTATKTIIITE
jgi:PKD repeat protein